MQKLFYMVVHAPNPFQKLQQVFESLKHTTNPESVSVFGAGG